MDDQEAEAVLHMIASALQTANLDYPETSAGTQWDQSVKSNEESRHLARAVLERLWSRGYEIKAKSDA